MDTFVNSSWYYLRYTDPKNNKKIFDSKKVNHWCPVDQYIGGPEHITMHLIYMRFYTKFLRDLGLIKFDEPALRYFTQGIVKGSDGEKMSKSKGNVIEPFDMINKYGADTLRLALVSVASSDNDTVWNEKSVAGSNKFLNNVFEYFAELKFGKSDLRIQSKLHKTIQEVTNDIQNFKHNLAVIKIRKLFSSFQDKRIDKETSQDFLKLLHVYCPFITEELWVKVKGKGFISTSDWPKLQKSKINDKFEKEDESVEKLSDDINHVLKLIDKKIKKVFVYVLPNEKNLYLDNSGEIQRKTNLIVEIFAVNDKEKYDPENKSKKVKPGKPGIYLE
jgi:leucyl-tRNA synthetase